MYHKYVSMRVCVCVYVSFIELKMLPLFLFCCVAIEILVRVLLNKNIVNEE